MTRIKIGVSACLLGQKVRYDGKDKFADLDKYFDPKLYQLIAICPEVEMGLNIPRPSIQMRIIDGDTRLVQVDDHKIDFTDRFNKWFDQNKQRFEQFQGFILKSKSPSCGYKTTPIYSSHKQIEWKNGFFATLIKNQTKELFIIDEICINNESILLQFKEALQNNKSLIVQ